MGRAAHDEYGSGEVKRGGCEHNIKTPETD
jgi:hypothetical protein